MTAKDWMLLIAGFVLGFVANLVAFPVILCAERWRQRRRFKPIAGQYAGYAMNGDKVGDISSTAVIEHLRDNLLRIRVAEVKAPGNVWVGEIAMDGTQGGSIVWKYETVHGDATKHRFGTKQCIYATIRGRDHFYLIGQRPDYGDELLVKDPANPVQGGSSGDVPADRA
jgi:hypothetical protein